MRALHGIMIGGLFTLLGFPLSQGQAADAPDPALAASWNYMQKEMPKVPYAVLREACAEAHLTIYHGTWGDAQSAQIAAFKSRFPCVSVQPFELATGPRRERYLSETRAGRYITDIVQDSDPGSLDDMASHGLLLNYVISNDASYADAVKSKGYWYPLRIGIAVNAWNTNLVSADEAKALFDWRGSIDPRWKGRLGISDPTTGGASYLPWYYWVKAYGPQFIEKLGQLKPRIFGVNEIGAALAAGDIAVAVGLSETPLTTLWLSGAPIQWSMPEPGVGPATGQGIAVHAPHPNAAKLYQEYSFALEGYAAWNKLGGPPARIGYTDQRDVAAAPWFKFPNVWFQYSTADATEQKQAIMDIYRRYILMH